MKKEEKNVQLLRYAMYFVFVIVLSSCDKDALGDKPVGELVPISINLLGISEGSSEDATRSSDADITPVTETVVLDDGMLMEMSLAPDPAAELRADSFPLANGVKFVLIAVNASNRYISHAEYTVVSGAPALSSSEAVHVPAGGTYRFICVSLNNATSPVNNAYDTLEEGAVPTFSNIQGNVDLLYWDSGSITVNASQTLNILFKHKFNRITYKISAVTLGLPISAIAANKIRLLYRQQSATLNHDGSLTPTGSATTTPPYAVWLSSSGWEVFSKPDTLYMGAITPQIRVESGAITLINLGPKPGSTTVGFAGLPVPLTAGKSYILTVNFTLGVKWANSNIYWDDIAQKLTFDPYLVHNDPEWSSKVYPQQRKQGVHFKWGSLIGIAAASNSEGKYTWSDATTMYIPVNPDSPKTNHTAWIKMSNETATTGGDPKWTGTGYASIPYAQGLDYGTTGRANNYLTVMPDSTGFYKGDICYYLNSSYRLPRSEEYGGDTGAWTPPGGTAYPTMANIFGQTLIPNYSRHELSQVFFPSSGYYSAAGNLADVGGINTRYGNSSARGNGTTYEMQMKNVSPTLTASVSTSVGHPVRCVLRE
jgi:hypothetical protein